jgi:hypothetical protein
MILILLQPTNNHHRDHALYSRNPNRDPTAMNRILARRVPQPVLIPERDFIPVELARHIPRADAPAQHRFALAAHPRIVVGHSPGVRAAVEENLVRVGEGDVDYDGSGDWEETLAQRGAEDPGVLGGEVFEY